MSTPDTTIDVPLDDRDRRLALYRARADPAMALISTFYLVLLLIPRVAITSHESSQIIVLFDIAFWAVLVADLIYRLRLTTDRRQRMFNLITILLLMSGPFVFFSISEDARLLVRVTLIAVVALRAVDSVRYFFRLRTMLYIVSAVILIVIVAGIMMTVLERDAPRSNITSLSSGLWWAVVTVSTVGYGDTYPVTNPGRMVATGLMFFGVAMFGILTATLANAFAARTEQDASQSFASIEERLERIEMHLAAPSSRRTRAPRRRRRRVPPPRVGGGHDQE